MMGEMAEPFASSTARVRYAIKPLSWPKLLVPAFFGQALGFAAAGSFSAAAALFGVLYVVTHLLLVVLLNDWSDRRVDALKRSMFPDSCSPKTIPDSILGERTVLTLGLVSLGACVAVSLAAERALGRPGFFVMGVGGIAIFLAYSFPPLRLNYRGGGELLEAFGVGYFLPALEAYLQSGESSSLASPLYLGTVLLGASSAIASGLSDERSDAAGGKSTFVTRFGNRRARGAVVALAYAGVAAWALASPWSGLHPALVLAVIAVVARDLVRLRALSPAAVTDAFAAQAALKSALHRVIWRGTTILGAAFVAQTLFAASQP
jgi:1,4-dihydroxy-2-naphthoate octaprenyltransferase